MKAEIYSQEGKMLRSIDCDGHSYLDAHVLIRSNNDTVAIVPNTFAIVFVTVETPPNWESTNSQISK